jgi:hypothetical protein
MAKNNNTLLNSDYEVEYIIGPTKYIYTPTTYELKTATIKAFANWYNIPVETAGAIIAQMNLYTHVATKFKPHVKAIIKHDCLAQAELELADAIKDIFRAK